jgi:hypothetical protein
VEISVEDVMALLLGFLGMIGSTVFLVSLFVPRWTWVAMWIYRALEILSFILLAACLGSAAASVFRKARSSIAAFYLYSSLVFAAFLWAECAFYVLSIWGRLWVAFGLFAGGLGVIPLAFVACISARKWDSVIEIPFVICLIVAVRLVAVFLATRSE